MKVNYPPAGLPLLQRRWEFEWLIRHFIIASPKRVLELGTASGGSLWAWSHNCQPGTKIAAVDIYHPTYDNRKEFPSWENGQCTIEAIQGNSHDQAIVEKVREHGPFDWLFIDADHHYEAVLKDWDNYMPMVAPGGIVAFHDIVPHGQPDVQVSRLWSEIQRDQWRTVTIMEDAKSTTCGIGIVHKY